MNGQHAEPINLLLSRDELVFVLRELQTDYLPGLDPDPLGPLTTEQEALVLAVAGRALRARELVRRFPEGELVLHNVLLTMVGVCAYSQAALMVYHWPAGATAPQRHFGHIRGEDVVFHSRPEESLHLFTLLPAKEALAGYVLEICRFEDSADTPALSFTIPADALGQARLLSAGGETAQGVETLARNGVETAAAQKFVETLAAPPRMSIMQFVQQTGNGDVLRKDFTLLQNGGAAWLALASEQVDAPLEVKTVNRAQFTGMLSELVGGQAGYS